MGKTKTFISAIPFQGKDGLKKLTYEPCGNSRLKYEATRFPIIPVINGYTEAGDKVRIIAILTDGENFRYNYETYFIGEIDSIIKEKDLSFDGIEEIPTADSEDIETQLKLFADIIAKIGDDEELYACITYGTKPTPIVQFMALNYAYRLKKGTSVGCVAYGRFLHKGEGGLGVGCIYDQTALFYMDSTVNKLAEHGAPDPERAIRIMLDLDSGEEAGDE